MSSDLLNAAISIGNDLCLSQAANDRQTENSLYAGKIGTSLFFASLFLFSTEKRWKEKSYDLIHELRSSIRQADFRVVLPRSGSLGMGGVGGVIYGLCNLATLLSDRSLIEEAKQLSSFLDENQIANDMQFDLMGGAAGLALGLLSLWKSSRDENLFQQLILCADHLFKHAINQKTGIAWKSKDGIYLLGLAHGTSGIAHALLRLGEVTAREKYIQMAREGLNFECSHFCKISKNWPRFSPEGPSTNWCSWCHGAAGIGLMRIANLSLLQEKESQNELRIAIHTTKEKLFSHGGYALCCGLFGRLEFLHAATPFFPELDLGQTVSEAVSAVVHKLRTKKLDTESEQNFDSFMLGKAGIGYFLLRLIDKNKRLPQVLVME